jgi:hypothetical protein
LFAIPTEIDEYGFFVELVRWQMSTFVGGAPTVVVGTVGVVVVAGVVVGVGGVARLRATS